MSQETITYLTNIVIAAILACLLTYHWLRHGRSDTMLWWMISAWVLTVADILFAARPALPPLVSRILPTVLVTVGHAGLFFGARHCAGRERRTSWAFALVIVHLAGLVVFYALPSLGEWRKVFNGLVWAAFAFASFWSLRRAATVYWQPLVAPANAFLLHGVFHGLRLGLASLFALVGWSEASAWLQILGDLEVSFFMVALFVSILVADLQLRNEELRQALSEVHTLSGLLPICSWCKKVRNDEGYWQRVEDYFATRSQLKFTHGICADCFRELNARKGRHESV